MKNIRFAIGLLGVLLLANAAGAQSLIIQWAVTGWPSGLGWLPKATADGQNGNVAIIYQTATGDATFNYFDGQMVISDIDYLYWYGPYDINSSGQPGNESGHDASIAMVDCLIPSCTSYPGYASDVIQVHQGGQNGGAKLWYRTGVDSGYSTTWAKRPVLR